MFSTTLRLDDDLAAFLHTAAAAQALSANGWLVALLRREQALAARRKLAADWAAYGQDAEAQDMGYAFAAQAEVAAAAAEPRRRTYRARKPK